MKITWLGQAGLLLENEKIKIMVDPYLSDSVQNINPANFRRIPIKQELFEIIPDVMIFTHDHLDHYDPETAPRFLANQGKSMTVLCPTSVWQKARQHGGGHNYVEFNRHTEWTEREVRFSVVKAAHSDPYAIGVIIEDLSEGKVYYITGDTLYNTEIFEDLPKNIDVVFLPVNGVGNNMNADDALRFAERTGAKHAVPIHIGMFDELSPEIFEAENRLVLEVYEEREI